MRDRLYVLGGENTSKTYVENEEYDPVADAWRARAPLAIGRHGLAAATVGDAIYVIGGGQAPGAAGVVGTNEAFSP